MNFMESFSHSLGNPMEKMRKSSLLELNDLKYGRILLSASIILQLSADLFLILARRTEKQET